ncbi:hypothetical protein ILUMI_16160 [Ignelater luminosus]|uniref:Uncharacterized protein n=1 Tax=Ignelater luminosus TaxID=2038154 RepID=A0A8K0CSS7_IGNLU|nr:hypothetical protein ILUMI_16160 [Ignelater luminosus]
MFQAMAVSDAVYFSNWYSHYFPSLKVPLLLILQNSQNAIVLKAGGLVAINAGTIVNVSTQVGMVSVFSSERITAEVIRFEAINNL